MTLPVEAMNISESIQISISSIFNDVNQALAQGITLTESQTQTIVIEPILKTLGYNVWEYQKTATSEITGQIPDYTMLPNTEFEWFLEVKKWKLILSEREAKQAVNYAANQGKRWAVLTNGDEWRIYDANCHEDLTRKCIFTTELSSSTAIETLSLLTKESMQQNLLAASHRARLLTESVQRELSTINSETVRI